MVLQARRTWLHRLFLVAASTCGAWITMCASAASSQTLTIGLACGAAGTSVWFDVTLDPQGKSIAAAQNDISFDGVNTPIATCTKNSLLATKDLSWTRLPSGCSGTACNIARGIVFSASNSDAILSPTVLYRCRVDIPANAAPGIYPLAIQNISGSDPLSNPKTIAGVDGQVNVTSGSCGC